MKRYTLLERLYAAYHANRIPVDDKSRKLFKNLSSRAILETAVYWEARAAGENPLDAITNREVRLHAAALSGCDLCPMGNPRTTSAIAGQERQYHGLRFGE